MNKIYTLVSLFIVLLFSDLKAQIYQYTNDLTGAYNYIDLNATGTGLSRVNGVLVLSSGCTDGFRSRNFSTSGTFSTAQTALQFSVTPAPGYQLDVTSFSTGNYRNGAGPTLYRVAYSTDGGTNWTDNGSNVLMPSGACTSPNTLSWNIPDFSTTNTLMVRVYAFGASSSAGQQRLVNLTLNGTVTLAPVPGCTDPIACNYDALANVDDGSCTYPGCTNPAACNYNATAGCDDGTCIVVGASCDDGDANTYNDEIQSDCNCVGLPVNDEQPGAVELTASPFWTCDNIIAVYMAFATTSANSQSSAVTGEDLWYSFIPGSTGIRVEVFSADIDLIVELQNSSGTMLVQENVIAGTGYEYLNKDGFVTGDTYYLILRNNDSGLGTGWADICIQEVPDSRIDNPIALYTNTCAVAKADWTGAYQYHFEFTNTSTLITTTLTKTNTTYFVIKDVPGMMWDQAFDVVVNSTYHLYDAAGGLESLYIESDETTTMLMDAHPEMTLRPQDQCPDGPNLLGSSVAGEPFVCMSTNYEWEFTRTDIPQAPIYHLRGAANRFLTLSTVSGLVTNATYSVRVRPIFSYGPGNWGPSRCMSTISPSSTAADAYEDPLEGFSTVWVEEENFSDSELAVASLYPNPMAGQDLYVNLRGLSTDEIVSIRCVDQTGRVAMTGVTETISDEDFVIHFRNELPQGTYLLIIEGADGQMLRNLFVAIR
ncbi:MAG: T9SS type A sorting domain-containing protein [Flavobacteriales bacterium]|nr:T9SS type A sorting domain-containing protein [Flavobacteriales bacterium]